MTPENAKTRFVNALDRLKKGEMSFSQALDLLKRGRWVRRSGWSGKHEIGLHTPTPQEACTKPHIIIITQDDDIMPWFWSQADLLAEDWVVKPEEDETG